MYNDENQADLRDTLRLSDLLRSMAEQSMHKQLRHMTLPGEHVTTRLSLIAESRSTLLTEGKYSYSLTILAANNLIGAADATFGSLAKYRHCFQFFA